MYIEKYDAKCFACGETQVYVLIFRDSEDFDKKYATFRDLCCKCENALDSRDIIYHELVGEQGEPGEPQVTDDFIRLQGIRGVY